ncbi:hypothetical protein [Desulfonatronovibrio hydrogenovorans]|uniref:hypothetical protein n=1 Tax=Desulfonatronovibrio hydrogenovorans TaxID=53245 RepID=UPI00048FF2EE|nr:hypothetical protein [Desulfonatronovibrio hydrogenovorans]
MRQKISFLTILVITLATVFLMGCREHQAVRFLWPDLDDPYIAATHQWTRTGSIYSGIETEIIVHATLKSREWMDAYVLKRGEVFALNQAEQEELLENMVRSLDTELAIFLSIYSPRMEQSRLRFNDPLWSVFILSNDQKIYPLEIRPVRKPLARLRTFYPYVHQWHQSYVLRFPAPASDSLQMIMAGPLGRIELEW